MCIRNKNPLRREKRNVYINGKRTSLSIETYIWAELDRISVEENLTIDDLCSKIDECRNKKINLSAVIRFLTLQVNAASRHKHHGETIDSLAEPPMAFPSPFYVALESIREFNDPQDHQTPDQSEALVFSNRNTPTYRRA